MQAAGIKRVEGNGGVELGKISNFYGIIYNTLLKQKMLGGGIAYEQPYSTGKKVSGFTSFTSFIQPARMHS